MSFARGALHVTKVIAGTAALSVVFVVSLVAGVLLHLGAGPVRRVVARELPVLLDGAFPGKLRVHALGALSIEGVGGVDVDLVHPDGAVVARGRDILAVRAECHGCPCGAVSAQRQLVGAAKPGSVCDNCGMVS